MDYGDGIYYYACDSSSYQIAIETSQALETRVFSTMIIADGTPLSSSTSSSLSTNISLSHGPDVGAIEFSEPYFYNAESATNPGH
ncbi:hypothetical protein RAB80_016462 [Fusarium oxysporum f. sp. vasinfectum]|uniref:Uncharacterized protein n=1 Tax=Fusarium oxysporum f. sp. vasinfectum 25433 TaxID=1089449 RepID=X0KM07_FUSOX|nr:hypothetical protein FOTG_17009 [Fusarium oxysporum f. sp. vasinfectum 25433]KAK2667271.1 hypothetical protein RAB80_016462 [Fusarium oxysporum f. sp. vasinfectum]